MATATAQKESPYFTRPEESRANTKLTLNRYQEQKTKKIPWLDHYQLIGEFIHTRRMDFTSTRTPGDFLTREIFDSSGPKAAKTAASSLLAMLWPQSRKFILEPPDGLQETAEVKSYYEKITRVVTTVLDNPKAGLPLALDEYMLSQITFGTSGIEIMPDQKTKVCYKAWDIKHLTIVEGKYGVVDTIYIELKWPVQRIVKEYGIENVSSKIKELFQKEKHNDEFDILIAIEPRIIFDSRFQGNKNMPFKSEHIEMESGHLLKEGGFSEMPIPVARFWKIIGEDYGRSPAMDALPSILEANAIWEAVTVAIEKNLDPPLGVLDDGKLGNGEIDTSAGAINVFNITGRAGDKEPVFPLFTVGEIKNTIELLQTLSKEIADHFFIDRLLDFNNQTQMTLGEANIRNRLRNATLQTIFSRQIAEVFSRIIERTFNLLLDQGELGVVANSIDHAVAVEFEGREPIIIPDEVVKLMKSGKDVYNIRYFTPAMRIMKSEEIEGIMRTWESATLMINAGVPDVADNLDADVSIRILGLAQAPSEILRAVKAVDELRKAREIAIQQAQAAQQLMQGSEAARNIGQSGLVPTVANQQKKAA